MSAVFRTITALALLAVCAFLAAFNWRLFQEPDPVLPPLQGAMQAGPPAGPGNMADAAGPARDIDPPDLAALTETIDRPLFEPSRRPVEAIAAVPDPDEPDEPLSADAPTLMGIVVEAGQGRALLRGQDGNSQLLGPGAVINGWLVERIGAGEVVVSADGRRETLRLYGGER